jgi:phosphatidylserine decarboxylase
MYIPRGIWLKLALIAGLAFLVNYFLGMASAAPFWVLLLILVYFFRDPIRTIPSSPLAVVSPVDGKLTAIDLVPNPFIDGDFIRMRIEMCKTGTYRIRSAIEGKVMKRWFLMPGDPLPVHQGPAVRLLISNWIQTDEGEDVVLALYRDHQWFTPQCDIQSGERIGQGQHCGFIPFGTTVEVYIPANSILKQEVGAKVKSGSDILAELRHDQA